jgi:hypothetical protein
MHGGALHNPTVCELKLYALSRVDVNWCNSLLFCSCSYENGILHIDIPKKGEPQPQKQDVQIS